MRLRLRILTSVVGVTVPCLAALTWVDGVARHSEASGRLADIAMTVARDGRESCEASPTTWHLRPLGPPEMPPGRPSHGPGQLSSDRPPPGPPPGGGPGWRSPVRPPQLWVYSEDGRPIREGAPALPDGALTLALGGVRSGDEPWWSDEVTAVVRTPWGTGPCTFVLAEGSTTRGWLGAVLPATYVWLTPLVLVTGVVLLAVGPVVGRLRRLTDAVRASAARGYQGHVELGGNDEIADLAAAFDQAGHAVQRQMGEAERRERALREFLANTTHDLMIPLTVLQGHLAALAGAPQAGRPDPGAVSAALDEAQFMAALVRNLAAVARLDTVGEAPFADLVELGSLVGRVVTRHLTVARARGVALDGAVPDAAVWVLGDVTLLEQALNNLVHNAVRYNHPDGHVAVVLDADQGLFELSVIDDGPGIADDRLATLRVRGARGDDARTRAPDGQGLGLDIVARVAALHGLAFTLARGDVGGLVATLQGPTHAPKHVGEDASRAV